MQFKFNRKIQLVVIGAVMVLWQNCSGFEAHRLLGYDTQVSHSSVGDVEPRNTFIDACNAASMAQVPGTSVFLGRIGVNLGPNGCTQNERYTSAVYNRTIDNNGDIRFTFSHKLLDIDQRINSNMVLSHSYDPYPFYINNQLFAVFECAINERRGSSVNVCVARVQESDYTINPSDIKILVRETYVDNHRLTAAVPKILAHPTGLFLYWNTVKINSRGRFIEVNARGTELFLNDDNELVDKFGASSFAAHSHDVVLSSPVNGSAEIYDITLGNDGQIYALGTIGESGCTHPAAPFNDCYRVAVFSSPSPLMESQATVNRLAHNMPLHSHEYSRFSWVNGRAAISMQFVKNDSNTEMQPSLVGQHRSFLLNQDDIFPEKSAITYIRNIGDLSAPVVEAPNEPVEVPVATPTPMPVANPSPPPVAAPPAPVASPKAPDYTSIVRRLYLEILQRPADTAGLNYYVYHMEQGTTEAEVRGYLLNSTEYKHSIEYPGIVKRLYREVLRREADPAGLEHYVNYMIQGQSESDIRGHLINSPEYKNL